MTCLHSLKVAALAERRVLPRKILFIESLQAQDSARSDKVKSKLEEVVRNRSCKIDMMKAQVESDEFMYDVLEVLLN